MCVCMCPTHTYTLIHSHKHIYRWNEMVLKFMIKFAAAVPDHFCQWNLELQCFKILSSDHHPNNHWWIYQRKLFSPLSKKFVILNHYDPSQLPVAWTRQFAENDWILLLTIIIYLEGHFAMQSSVRDIQDFRNQVFLAGFPDFHSDLAGISSFQRRSKTFNHRKCLKKLSYYQSLTQVPQDMHCSTIKLA